MYMNMYVYINANSLSFEAKVKILQCVGAWIFPEIETGSTNENSSPTLARAEGGRLTAQTMIIVQDC